LDIPFNCIKCGQKILIDEAGAGMVVNCPSCSASITVPNKSTPSVVKAPPPIKEVRMKEYKVMTQKDRFFAGKFDPEKLEDAINSYASQGWIVKAIATASIPGVMGGNREEMVIVLERDK
jgi:DNA-directed RNA polymerase subunit RPC12/RpoP